MLQKVPTYFEVGEGALAIQQDGKILLGGFGERGGYQYKDFALFRYHTDGKTDDSFGEGGMVVTQGINGEDVPTGIVVQPDGKFILADTASDIITSHADFALCRLNKDGSLDSSFAVDDKQLTSYNLKADAAAYCATLQQDGKIVLGGVYQDNKKEYSSYLLVRYNGDKEQKSLIARMKQFLHNHGISWQVLDNKNISYYSFQFRQN